MSGLEQFAQFTPFTYIVVGPEQAVQVLDVQLEQFVPQEVQEYGTVVVFR